MRERCGARVGTRPQKVWGGGSGSSRLFFSDAVKGTEAVCAREQHLGRLPGVGRKRHGEIHKLTISFSPHIWQMVQGRWGGLGMGAWFLPDSVENQARF